MVSIGMSCIMAGSTCNLPMMLHAEEVQTENMKPTYMVTSFDELNEEIAYQALSIGAEESEINFPDTLKVKVIRQVEEESSTEADEEEASTEAVEEEPSTEVEEETTSKVLESQTEAESQTEVESEVESGTETEVKPQTEVESQTEIESESQTEVELQTEVENETLESESETEVPMTETEVPETTAASEPQTQAPETTASESETESTEQLESDTTEEESSIVASLIDSIKGLFAPVEVYAAEEYITYSVGEGNGAEDSQEGEEWIIEHITWKLDAEKSSLPEFDSSEESAGAVYIYTPTIPETDENGNHYILSEEAILPEIYVMVDGVDNGIVLCSSNIVASGTCGAEGNNGDNLTWILDDEGVLTISGTGAMASWENDSPWHENQDIKSVMIEDGVTSIGHKAFFRCSGLANITFPNSVKSIGVNAFYGCSGLTSIKIPNSVTSIGNYTFSGCIGLTRVIYLGTEEQWNNLTIGSDNDYCLKATKIFHVHTPANDFSFNATYHWYQCTDEACPVKDEPQAQDGCALHEWENGICRVCQYSCNHTGGTATCTKKAVCTECGIEYGEKDSNKHENLYHAAQAPTCTKNGYEAYWKCKNCAKLFSDEAGTHEISNPVEINASGHDLKKVEKKAPTCTEIGWEAYDTCSHCNYTTYVELPKLNHDLEHHEAKAATCTEIGWDAYDTCKREGCTYSTYVELPKLNHDLEHHEAKAATCTGIGWEAYDTCKREGCNYSTYKEIAALNHDLEHHEAKAATCTEIGWEAYDTCKREGCTYSTYKEIAALNHDLEHHEAQAATCTEIGWEAYDICKREGCNYTTYKELPALGHEDSNNDHLCDACSTKISDHSYESKIAREATTTYTGIRIYTCTKCGHSYTEELAKLPSQTNQADQTNQIEPVNNGNEKDFIETVTSVFLNVTNFAAKNFIISFGSMIQMPSQTDQANQSNQPDQTNQIEPANNGNEKDFIGTVTSVFLNVTDLAAKNFRISFWLMIQMLLKAVMQLW